MFISYAGADRPWAEWAAWQLRAAGYSVEMDVDWRAGDNVVVRMNDALERARLVLMLWSPAYFEHNRFTGDEWAAVMAERPHERPRLVPVRLADVEPPRLLKPLIYRDLHALDEEKARTTLVEAVGGRDARGRPGFPGTAKAPPKARRPRLPGDPPPVWNVPPLSPHFTGRDDALVTLRERLCGGGTAVHGLGGVGKTTLATEYAHRFAGAYDLVWWIDADQPALIGDQIIALGVEAGWVSAGDPAASVLRRLRGEPGWLLIFDNAERREDLRQWFPHGPGHVLVTSRNPGWGQLVQPVPLPEFSRAESVALLRRSLPSLGDEPAGDLAGRLGDLPLALAQAGEMLTATGMSVGQYLTLLTERTAVILSEGVPDGYPAPLAAVVRTSLQRLAAEDEAAGRVLTLCAFLAPEPIPTELFTATTEVLTFARISRRIGAYGLARLGEGTLRLHRLTQAVIRDSVDPAERPGTRKQAERLLAAARPDDGRDPVHWPRWAQLMPHLTALDPAGRGDHEFRELACHASSYLLCRGDTEAAREFCALLHDKWRDRLGPGDAQALFAGVNLATAYSQAGRYGDALLLEQDIYHRRRAALGDDHADTLVSAGNLAGTLGALGRYDDALRLEQDTCQRRRAVFGDDHPDTLISASNLAGTLESLGRYDEALRLEEDTLRRRRALFGDGHPDTLSSANNFAGTIGSLGRHEEASQLCRDTYERCRRVLGDDHPETLATAGNLATALSHLGRHEEALRLSRDTYDRRRRALGPDHPDTLHSADHLAIRLGQSGRRLDGLRLSQDTYDRRCRLFGQDHPETRRTATGLAHLLRITGKPGQARDITPA
ncbi:FxSxx-COOH system tetratricopeptide repeat protein [Actinoplanes sp. NPDC051411]|uniref:FxSxx-COOH system tetratricopeptide repeat protein n=1 Tax=Actinoplanes sp. NPDC051411 TaxID=3155522 RepID=UPI00341B7AB3